MRWTFRCLRWNSKVLSPNSVTKTEVCWMSRLMILRMERKLMSLWSEEPPRRCSTSRCCDSNDRLLLCKLKGAMKNALNRKCWSETIAWSWGDEKVTSDPIFIIFSNLFTCRETGVENLKIKMQLTNMKKKPVKVEHGLSVMTRKLLVYCCKSSSLSSERTVSRRMTKKKRLRVECQLAKKHSIVQAAEKNSSFDSVSLSTMQSEINSPSIEVLNDSLHLITFSFARRSQHQQAGGWFDPSIMDYLVIIEFVDLYPRMVLWNLSHRQLLESPWRFRLRNNKLIYFPPH